jgi:hypothetical protein
MTLADRRNADAPDAPAPPPDGAGAETATGRPRSGKLTGFAVVAAVAVIVALLAQAPLIRNHIFYYWDDSAAAFLPHWYQMGLALRSGHWPVLDPTMWMGGNIAAESMLGLFNPVSLANFVIVSWLPDLALSATFVKTEFLVLLAVGVYLLAREYGANRTASAAIATALPFTGYTVYFDAEAWAGGLMCYAWVPFVWWAARRYSRGALNPFVVVVFGYLAMTTGNPYGALAVIVVLVAVALELLIRKQWKRFGGLVLTGAAIGISSMVVFLPLLGSSAVTWRNAQGVTNDGFMVPNLGDLFAMSAPTYQPQFHAFATGVLTTPVAYVAWFVVPLAPWLRWSALRENLRGRVSLLTFAVLYLLLLVGPSNLWLFRWPARLFEYATLPIGIAVAIVLTGGIRVTRWQRRAFGSALLIAAGAYLSWASTPASLHRHLLAAVVVAAFLAAVVWLSQRRPKFTGAALISGTAVVLVLQAVFYTGNYNITPWYFPHDVAAMKADFAHRYQGNTLMVGDVPQFAANAPETPDGIWRDVLLAGPMHVAGVDALNSYTGIGDVKFADALCMNYYGGTCMDAYSYLWKNAQGTGVNLADALRLQTVVAANPAPAKKTPADQTSPAVGSAGGVPADNDQSAKPLPVAPGWSVQEKTKVVTVFKRDAPVAWPQGRLSYNSGGVTVTSDVATSATGETTKYSGTGRVVFATLAWPGWTATVDGKPLAVRQGPAGLIQLDLPPAAAGGSTIELSFTPPGYQLGIPLVGVGLLLGLGYGVVWWVTRRRRSVQAI